MNDEILDLLLFIILLSVTVPVGFKTALNTYRETKASTQNLAEDKNSKSIEGYGVTSTTSDDGSMSVQEVALLTQIQDAYMGEPGLIYVTNYNGGTSGSTAFRVNTDYTSNVSNILSNSWNILRASNNNKYTIEYGCYVVGGETVNFWKIVESEYKTTEN